MARPFIPESPYLYHYTSSEAYQLILRDRRIKMSTGGYIGPGVYLTHLPPHMDNQTIVYNNYGLSNFGGSRKVKMCFRFCVDDLPGYKVRQANNRVIYMYPKDIDLNTISYQVTNR